MFDRKAYMKEYNKTYREKHRERLNARRRQWYRENLERERENHRKWYARHPNFNRDWQRKHKMKVNGRLRYDLNKRDYPKDEACEICGRTNTLLTYHHWDDGKPDLGLWVCNPCDFGAHFVEKGFVEAYLNLKKQIAKGYEFEEVA